MKLIGISGSLRKESFNTKMLHAAASCLPENLLQYSAPQKARWVERGYSLICGIYFQLHCHTGRSFSPFSCSPDPG